MNKKRTNDDLLLEDDLANVVRDLLDDPNVGGNVVDAALRLLDERLVVRQFILENRGLRAALLVRKQRATIVNVLVRRAVPCRVT